VNLILIVGFMGTLANQGCLPDFTLLGRFAPAAAFVPFGQTFVRRSQNREMAYSMTRRARVAQHFGRSHLKVPVMPAMLPAAAPQRMQ